MQLWTAEDFEYRLNAEKMLRIVDIAAQFQNQTNCRSTWNMALMSRSFTRSETSFGIRLDSLLQQQKQYEKQLARDHAEIKRIAALPKPNDPTLARLAELNERTAQAELELHQLKL